jgi:hypothetical protein
MGNFGCGKTSAWLSIARKAQLTKSDAQFYVLDTDDSAEGMVELNDEYSKLTNLHITTAYEYPEYMAWLKKIREKVNPWDWVIVDFVDVIWEATQRYFTEEVFQEDMGNYFLQARKALSGDAKNMKAFEGWTDWQVINKLYGDFANPLFKRTRCNLYCVSKIEEVREDEKNRETRQLFGAAKVKPTGQKHLGFQFRTIVVFSKVVSGETERFTYTTIKDRERELQKTHKCDSFVTDYLQEIASWKLGNPST